MILAEVNTHFCYLLGTFMYHDIGESGSVQSNSSSQTSNTSPNYDNLEVRDLGMQIVLQERSISARKMLKYMPSRLPTADIDLTSMSGSSWVIA
jgi:hypothetical protein